MFHRINQATDINVDVKSEQVGLELLFKGVHSVHRS